MFKPLYLLILFGLFVRNGNTVQKTKINASMIVDNWLDSLSKYSYPIFVITGNQQHTGTAFFYLEGDVTYLVSNYHAIKGMNPLHKKIEYSSDTLWLKYQQKGSNNYKEIKFDISEKNIGKTELFSMMERIDLLKIRITPPADGEINYINDLIDISYFDKIPDNVFLFGHPIQPGSVPLFFSSKQKFEGLYSKDGFGEYDSAVMVNFPKLPEADRDVLKGAKRFYYFIKPLAEHGYSGSPVLAEFVSDKDGKPIYKFWGVIFASEPHSQQTWVIRGDIVYKYLKNQL